MSSDQPALGFVGAGKAGSALSLALFQAGYPVTAVCSRTPEHARLVAERTGAAVCASPVDAARLSEVLFLTVPDGAVSEVTHEIAGGGGFRPGSALLHVSGSLTRDALAEATRHGAVTGVFHPLQALAGFESAPLLRGAYAGIEAEPDLLPVLTAMAEDLGMAALTVTPERKAPYHIAAVLAANYTLVLLRTASELMEAAGIEHEQALPALLALARGSLANLERTSNGASLTGPAVRGDERTIARHLEYLAEHRPEVADVYRKLGLLALDLQPDTPNRDAVREGLEG